MRLFLMHKCERLKPILHVPGNPQKQPLQFTWGFYVIEATGCPLKLAWYSIIWTDGVKSKLHPVACCSTSDHFYLYQMITWEL